MNNPLVSIRIITYNSSKYILETLDSAKNQIYKNLELIISDDCSTDNTIELCRHWIDINKKRFVRVELLTVKKNTGIAANCNRADIACKGEWIKGLAGDDLLLPDCIENYVKYINEYSDAKIIFSQMVHFSKNCNQKNIIPSTEQNKLLNVFFKSTLKEQLFIIAHKCILPAPTLFYKKEIIQALGGFDTNYYFEDWPMWLKILEKGISINYLEKETIAYRHHNTGVSTHSETLFNIKMEKSRMKFIKDKCCKYYSKRKLISEILMYNFRLLIYFLNLNHNNFFCRIIYSPVIRLLNYSSEDNIRGYNKFMNKKA